MIILNKSVLVWKGDGSRLNARYLFEGRARMAAAPAGGQLSLRTLPSVRPQGIVADYKHHLELIME